MLARIHNSAILSGIFSDHKFYKLFCLENLFIAPSGPTYYQGRYKITPIHVNISHLCVVVCGVDDGFYGEYTRTRSETDYPAETRLPGSTRSPAGL